MRKTIQALHNTGNDHVIDGQTADQRFILDWACVNGALPQIDE